MESLEGLLKVEKTSGEGWTQLARGGEPCGDGGGTCAAGATGKG